MDSICQCIASAWTTTKPVADLEYALLDSIRNLDYDENSASVSGLLATPLPHNGTGTVPYHVLHVIVGIVSDTEFLAQLNIGGRDVSNPFSVTADVNTPILNGWPIPDTQCHEIKVLGIPKEARVCALGVRVKKELLSTVTGYTRVPGLLVYMKGISYPDNGCHCDNTWSQFI